MAMKSVVIENPIVNSLFEEPKRHFRFDDEGITSEIVEKRRTSQYFIPIAKPKKKDKQLQLEMELWTNDRIEENGFINQIRQRVSFWRNNNYRATANITPITRKLLLRSCTSSGKNQNPAHVTRVIASN